MSALLNKRVQGLALIFIWMGLCVIGIPQLFADDVSESLQHIENVLTEIQKNQSEILENQKKAFEEIHELKIRIRRA